ncbi:GNAT family N-acetyltransferase [Aspergillus venezuelensis]
MAKPYTIRSATPADMPTIISRHGTLYSIEHNFNATLAASVAEEITKTYLSTNDRTHEQCWVAQINSSFAGCVMLVRDSDSDECAKLRLLLVEPSARGSGLGMALVKQCTAFARGAGYKRVRLWTNSGLVGARKLYVREGYRRVREEEDSTFGIPLTAEFWELVL